MNLTNFSTNDLKTMATERLDSVLRTAARKELDKRGVSYSSSAERASMDQRMGMGSRRGTSAPCVRRDGRNQTFGGTAASRPAEHDKADMDRRMGLGNKTPEVRRDGRTQVFETMTAADARRAIRKDGAK